MTIDRIIGFDIWGDYANFRNPYSTTSTLTYPFPTRTALAGLICGIIGREKNTYYEEFSEQNSRIGIQILSPIRKINIGFNLIDTKKGYYLWDIRENPRTQILYEVLQNLNCRIYLWLKSEKTFSDVIERLVNHTSVFTPYLGLAQMIANFKFIKEFTSIKRNIGSCDSIATVVPEDYGIKVSSNHIFGRTNMPIFMDKDRNPSFNTLIYDSCKNFDTQHHAIQISNGEYFTIDDNINIVLL